MPKKPLTDMINAFSIQQMELIRNAGKHKQEVIIQSLENLKGVINDPQGHPYRGYVSDSLMLLAYMEEERAHDLLMQLIQLPEYQIEELIGVALPNQLAVFLYKTMGKSSAPIKQLIQNPNAYFYCRAAGIKALVLAAQDGTISKTDALDFLASLYTGNEADFADNCFWDDVTESICSLQPQAKHFETIKQAIAKGLTSIKYINEEYATMLR